MARLDVAIPAAPSLKNCLRVTRSVMGPPAEPVTQEICLISAALSIAASKKNAWRLVKSIRHRSLVSHYWLLVNYHRLLVIRHLRGGHCRRHPTAHQAESARYPRRWPARVFPFHRLGRHRG